MAWFKVGFICVALFAVSDLTTFTAHNLFLYYAIFVVVSAIVSGMPEPNMDLMQKPASAQSIFKFVYLWVYRSAHLMVASATVFLSHEKWWPKMDEPQAAASNNDTINDAIGEKL